MSILADKERVPTIVDEGADHLQCNRSRCVAVQTLADPFHFLRSGSLSPISHLTKEHIVNTIGTLPNIIYHIRKLHPQTIVHDAGLVRGFHIITILIYTCSKPE